MSPLGDGAAAARLVAVRDLNASDPVVTSLAVAIHTVAGRPNLASLAENAIKYLRKSFAVTVLNSDVEPTDDMSEFNQLLEISHPIGDLSLELRQIRILIAVPAEQEGTAVILQLVMTTPVKTFPEAAHEFREFVATLTSGPVHLSSADTSNPEGSTPMSQTEKE